MLKKKPRWAVVSIALPLIIVGLLPITLGTILWIPFLDILAATSFATYDEDTAAVHCVLRHLTVPLFKFYPNLHYFTLFKFSLFLQAFLFSLFCPNLWPSLKSFWVGVTFMNFLYDAWKSREEWRAIKLNDLVQYVSLSKILLIGGMMTVAFYILIK